MTISLAPLVVAAQLAAAVAGSSPQTQAASEWERVDALPPGTRVQITRASGERHLYIFRRATADAIVASREAGAAGDERIPKADVTKLVQRDVRDGATDGTAAGALIGFGAAIGLMAIAYANACDTCDPPAFWVLAGPAGGVGAGAGALTGFLLDRRRLGSRVLYVREPR